MKEGLAMNELIYFVIQKEGYCQGRWNDTSGRYLTLSEAKRELDFISSREFEFETNFRIVEKIEIPLPSTFVTVTPKKEE